jgi:hypothetical protein
MAVQIQSLFILALDEGDWSASFISPFIPGESGWKRKQLYISEF